MKCPAKYFDIGDTSNLLALSAYQHHQPPRQRWWRWIVVCSLGAIAGGNRGLCWCAAMTRSRETKARIADGTVMKLVPAYVSVGAGHGSRDWHVADPQRAQMYKMSTGGSSSGSAIVFHDPRWGKHTQQLLRASSPKTCKRGAAVVGSAGRQR